MGIGPEVMSRAERRFPDRLPHPSLLGSREGGGCMELSDEELQKRKIKRISEAGCAAAGVGMAGRMQVGMSVIRAEYHAEVEKHFNVEWAKILRNYGAIKWSGDPARPYVWLWGVNDLAGLKPYTPYSWGEWASLFYKGGKKLKGKIRVNQDQATDWSRPKKIKGDDLQESREFDLPAILKELQSAFLL